MTPKSLSAGDKIDARCSKCGGTTRHIILAISGQTPNRVKCDLCDREHNYQPPSSVRSRPAKAAATPRKTVRRGSDPREAERRQWEELNPEAGGGTIKPYAMDGSYRLTERIAHPVFGIGVVVGLPGSRKVEILFKDGKRILRCA